MRVLMGIAVAGAIVWGFALIGIATVAATLTAPEPEAPASILSADTDRWDSRHIAGLPQYPGSMNQGFRRDVLGTLVRTESQYSTADPIEVVYAYYESLIREGEWVTTDMTQVAGERTLSVESEGRHGIITLRESGPFTRITVEVSDAAESRGGASHR